MKGRRNRITTTLLAALVLALLVGCSTGTPTGDGTGGTGQVELTSGVDGLDAGDRLALGTLQLEGTEDAVTPAQATKLLPLWQMVAGGSLQSEAETNAVLAQVEGAMTEAQLAAIDAQLLTSESIQSWMQEQGFGAPAGNAGPGGAGGMSDLSEDERAKMRQELQNMTPEEREARMAELGIVAPQGRDPDAAPGRGEAGGGSGRLNPVLNALIRLLTERAAA